MMLSPDWFIKHDISTARTQRWLPYTELSPSSFQARWKNLCEEQRDLLRQDLCWLLPLLAPTCSLEAWNQVGVGLLRESLSCLEGAESAEACAYFAKAVDHMFWCHQAEKLEKSPAYFIARIYQYLVKCAQAAQNQTVLIQLDTWLLTCLAENQGA